MVRLAFFIPLQFYFILDDHNSWSYRVARILEDVYACHNTIFVEILDVVGQGRFKVARNPIKMTLLAQQLLCLVCPLDIFILHLLYSLYRADVQLHLNEVPGSAGFLWDLPDSEDLTALENLTLATSGVVIHTPIHHNEVKESVLRSTVSQNRRHMKNMRGDEDLCTQVSVSVRPFKDHVRSEVCRILRTKMDTLQWRSEVVLFGWDESLFLAVFGELGVPSPFSLAKPPPSEPVALEVP